MLKTFFLVFETCIYEISYTLKTINLRHILYTFPQLLLRISLVFISCISKTDSDVLET